MTIRLALVGLGNMGRRWLRVANTSRRFRVVAIADPNANDATHLALNDQPPPFDVAIVATPTRTHYDVAAELLSTEGVRAVLVEKPLAHTTDHARRLAEYAHAADTALAVGHVERFNPAVRAAASALARGEIGDLVHLRAARVGGYPTTTRGTSALLDLAVHDLDIVRMLIGPLRVDHAYTHEMVESGTCDTAEVSVSTRSGVTGTVHADWLAEGKSRTLGITGTRGALWVDYVAQTCVMTRRGERVELPVERAEPLALQLDAFADLVESGDMGSLCSGEDGAAAVALAEQAALMGRREFV